MIQYLQEPDPRRTIRLIGQHVSRQEQEVSVTNALAPLEGLPDAKQPRIPDQKLLNLAEEEAAR